MKKAIALILTLAMSLSLAACSGFVPAYCGFGYRLRQFRNNQHPNSLNVSFVADAGYVYRNSYGS